MTSIKQHAALEEGYRPDLSPEASCGLRQRAVRTALASTTATTPQRRAELDLIIVIQVQRPCSSSSRVSNVNPLNAKGQRVSKNFRPGTSARSHRPDHRSPCLRGYATAAQEKLRARCQILRRHRRRTWKRRSYIIRDCKANEVTSC